MKVLFTGLIFGSVLFLVVPFQAEAQGIQIEYKKQTSNSELTINYSSGGYWGCGSGYFNRGYSYGVGSSYIYKGTYSAGYSSFSPYRYYAPSYRSYFYMPRSVYHYAPQYSVSEGGDRRFSRTQVLKEWEEGLREFKSGDYAGAADSFKKAILSDSKDPMTQFYFGLALAGTGDRRNATKAILLSLESLPSEDIYRIDFPSLFRSGKEAKSYRDRSSGDDILSGVLAVLAGENDRARKILSKHKKNAAARKLLRFMKSQ